METNGLGIIVDYKYVKGERTGQIYRKRFDNIDRFVRWCEEYDNPGIVKIINSKVVDEKRVYWDDRWVENAAR